MPSIDGIAVSSTAMKEMIALAIDWRRSGGQR